jgi:hypothetical protein
MDEAIGDINGINGHAERASSLSGRRTREPKFGQSVASLSKPSHILQQKGVAMVISALGWKPIPHVDADDFGRVIRFGVAVRLRQNQCIIAFDACDHPLAWNVCCQSTWLWSLSKSGRP